MFWRQIFQVKLSYQVSGCLIVSCCLRRIINHCTTRRECTFDSISRRSFGRCSLHISGSLRHFVDSKALHRFCLFIRPRFLTNTADVPSWISIGRRGVGSYYPMLNLRRISQFQWLVNIMTFGYAEGSWNIPSSLRLPSIDSLVDSAILVLWELCLVVSSGVDETVSLEVFTSDIFIIISKLFRSLQEIAQSVLRYLENRLDPHTLGSMYLYFVVLVDSET